MSIGARHSLGGLIALVLSAGSGCGAAVPPRVEPPRRLDPATCGLDAYPTTVITPHIEEDHVIKMALLHVHGAELVIPARPGLTAQWLLRDLSETDHSAPACALGVIGAELRVEARDAGFVVTIRTDDEDAAREILRRARVSVAPAPR